MDVIKELNDKIKTLHEQIEEARSVTKTSPTIENKVKYNDLMDQMMEVQDELVRENKYLGVTSRMNQPITKPVEATRNAPQSEFRSLGDYLQAVISTETPGNGRDPRLVRATGMNEANPADGGFAIAPEYGTDIMVKTWEASVFAPKCFRIPMKSNSLKIPYLRENSRADGSRHGGIRGYWMEEAADFTTVKPGFNQMQLNPHKVGVFIDLTDELMEDAPALEAFVSNIAAKELAFMLDAAIVSGNGAGKPLGITQAACKVDVSRNTASKIYDKDLVNMWSRMPAESMKNSYWFGNQDIIPQLYTMTIGNSGYAPMFVTNVAPGAPSTIFGRPVIFTEHVASLGGAGDLLLVDLSQYILGERGGIKAASSIHLRFLSGEQSLRFALRIDGQPGWESAVTPYSGSSNTLSPLIRLV